MDGKALGDWLITMAKKNDKRGPMYYSEFVQVAGRDAAMLHDDEGVMYVGIIANEFDEIEYLTASELRTLAGELELRNA